MTGDIEFRNELIRAQAYYSLAAPTRHYLHRQVAELLTRNQRPNDRGVCLEIAWHHLRGQDVAHAIPFAIEGAEAMLAVGAPHEAEEVLRTIVELEPHLSEGKRVRLLLAKAFLDQSKAQPALPIIDQLASENELLTLREQAEVAMLRASAEFALNRAGPKYCEVAKVALVAAKNTGDAQLVAQALFECARAGTEEGFIDLIRATEDGIQTLLDATDVATVPMAALTKAYCRFFLGDPKSALTVLKNLLQTNTVKVNAAQRAFIHSGLGITNQHLGKLEDSYREHFTALELARKVGDDARLTTIAANLCTVQMNRGDYEDSIRYGRMSVKYGESCSCSTMLISYTNLMDPYMLSGQESAAMDCLAKATKWIGPERRWKLRLTFLSEAASFALIQRNLGLALDLIDQLVGIAYDREEAVPMPGAYWKLKSFRMAQSGQTDKAYSTISGLAERWRTTCVFHYADMIATKAWLERYIEGTTRPETQAELGVFDLMGAIGKKQLLTLQGFLVPRNSVDPTREPRTLISKGS